jgi:hypothetical protein
MVNWKAISKNLYGFFYYRNTQSRDIDLCLCSKSLLQCIKACQSNKELHVVCIWISEIFSNTLSNNYSTCIIVSNRRF